jgi:hypothetical protein
MTAERRPTVASARVEPLVAEAGAAGGVGARRLGLDSAGMRSPLVATYSGCSTIALPPPRRTGSAAASTRPSVSSSMPVAAPISLVVENW